MIKELYFKICKDQNLIVLYPFYILSERIFQTSCWMTLNGTSNKNLTMPKLLLSCHETFSQEIICDSEWWIRFLQLSQTCLGSIQKMIGKMKSKAFAVAGPCVLTYSSESHKHLRKTHSLLVLGMGLLSDLSLRSLTRLLSGREAVLANDNYNNQKMSVPFREKKM